MALRPERIANRPKNVRSRTMAAVIVLAVLPHGLDAQSVSVDSAPSADTSPVSLDRIRKALDKPRPPALIDRRPNFSVSVTDSLPWDNPFGVVEKPRRSSEWRSFFELGGRAAVAGAIGLAAATASLAGDGTMSAKPLIAMDVLAAGMAVAGKVGTALHNRKVRKTREQVRRELEEFCKLRGCTPP
jgi:hypothetical protein